jgi:hypothetical protein
MKKLIGIILLSIPAYLTTGQATYNDSREDFLMAMQRNKNYRAHIVAGNIASVQTFGYKHANSEGYLMFESRYDKRGNNTDWFLYRNGKVKQHNAAKYDDSNMVTEFAFYKGSGKLKRMTANTYDKSGNLVEQDLFRKNPKKLYTKTIKTYDSRNNITGTKLFNNKGELQSRIEYTYYDDGSKKQTTEYNGSGKVKRIWNFDCNPVGKSEAKKIKDTAKICIHYEKDSAGNPIKIRDEYTHDGWFGATVRTITKYDKDNNMIDVATYNLNGKRLSRWSASYNASGRITEYILYKDGTGKPQFRTTYTYNKEGNMEGSVIYKKTNVPFSSRKYIYTSSVSVPAK